MVQSYGSLGDITKYSEVDDPNVGEGSALIADDATKRPVIEAQASLASCISNLANTIIGSGTSNSFTAQHELRCVSRNADIPIGTSFNVRVDGS